MKFLAAVLAVFSALAAQGAFFSNLGNNAQPFPLPVDATTPQWAVGFTVTGNQPVQLSTIAISASPSSASSIILEIRANDSGNPAEGSPIGTFTGPSESTGQGGFSTYTFGANVTLAGEGEYWIVFKRNGASSYSVPDRGSYSTDGASYLGTRYFFNNSWENANGSYLSLDLEATPVPEPAHSSAAAAAFLVLCALGRACGSRRLFSKARSLFR